MPFDSPATFDDSPPEYIPFGFPLAHDWTVGSGDWTFGIYEQDFEGLSVDVFSEPTTIFIGPTQFTTRFTAFEVLAAVVITALVIFACVSLVVARAGRRTESAG
jgi:hypothetical protein